MKKRRVRFSERNGPIAPNRPIHFQSSGAKNLAFEWRTFPCRRAVPDSSSVKPPQNDGSPRMCVKPLGHLRLAPCGQCVTLGKSGTDVHFREPIMKFNFWQMLGVALLV